MHPDKNRTKGSKYNTSKSEHLPDDSVKLYGK